MYRHGMTGWTSFLLLVCGLFCHSGCSTALPTCKPPAPEVKPDHTRVDMTFRWEKKAEDTRAEVVATDKYGEIRNEIKAVAVRAPDSCLDTTAARASGDAKASDVILKSSCSIYLKELERELVKKRYRVISWDVLYRAESVAQQSTYEAAAELGADIVFIINSLETSQRGVMDEVQLTWRYFKSNAQGEAKRPAKLGRDTRDYYVRFILGQYAKDPKEAMQLMLEKTVGKHTALSATLDVTAVSLDTRESVWFYNRTMTRLDEDKLLDGYSRSYLFAKWKDNRWPVTPENLGDDSKEKDSLDGPEHEYTTEDTITASGKPDTGSKFKRLQKQMMRKIVTDFVDKFNTGESTSAS